MTVLAHGARVMARDLRVEAAGREAVTVVLPFVGASVLLAGLAFGSRPEVQQAVVPGLTWLVVLFAAVPLARAVAAAEREEGCWDLLVGAVPLSALWAGKVAALWCWLAATWTVAAVLAAAALGASLTAAGAAGGALGTLGVAAATVTFGTVVAGGAARTGLLAVLLLPAALPALLAGTQAATSGVAPGPWLALLAAYDATALATGWAVFPVLVEE